MLYLTPERRIEQLQQFLNNCKTVDPKIDSNFHGLFREALVLLEMSEAQIANAISVTRPTVNRWFHGKNLPHVALRNSLVRGMHDRVSDKLRIVTAITGRVARSDYSYSHSHALPVAAKSR